MCNSNDEQLPLLPTYDEKLDYNGTLNDFNSKLHEKSSENITVSIYKKEKSARIIGNIVMLLAALSFSTANTCLRIAETIYNLPPELSQFLLFGTGTVSIYTYAIISPDRKQIFTFTKKQSIFLGCRAIFGTISSSCFVVATSLMPIGDASTAFNVCPTMTLMFAALFLGEKILKIDILALIISLFGVFLITRPNPETILNSTSQQQLIGGLLAASAGTLAALAYVSIRNLKQSIHFVTPVLFFLPSCTLMAIFLGGGIPSIQKILSYGTPAIITISVAGLLTVVAQVCLSIGLQKCPAGPAIFFRNLEIPLQYLLGYEFLNEMVTSVQFFAAGLIICSTIIIGLRNTLTGRKS